MQPRLPMCLVTAMYRNADDVRNFVSHVRSCRAAADIDLIVADNAADQGIGTEIPGALLFASPHNLGYVPGCARAFTQWRERGGGMPQWLCIANNDIRFADDFFEVLLRSQFPDDAGMIAPDVRLPDGAPQNPLLYRRPPRLMMLAYAVLTQLSLFLPLFELSVRARHRLRCARPSPRRIASSHSIYAAHGSILLLHRRFLERGGSLHYRGTMFGEEIHFAEQVRRAGLRTIYVPGLHVEHRQHATMRAVPRGQRQRWYAESADVLWRDYFAGP